MKVVALALLVTAMASANAQTVILYSQADAHEAQRIHRLAMTYSIVMRDVEIPPGEPWRATVAGWIRDAKTILILWSANAANSAELAPEWRMALASGARVVPIMLDATPMPAELAERQAVDWR
jgi:hypothetical protein